MDTVTIIGIKKTASTKNPQVSYYNYYYTSPYSNYDMEHALEISGKACGSDFATVDIGCKVGDEVEFKYTKGFQDKATLIGCTVINPAPVNIGKK